MAALVLDCSVAVSMAFEDEVDDYSLRALEAARRNGALVPRLWPFEVANALNLGIKRSRLTMAGAERFLTMLTDYSIKIEPDDDRGSAATARQLLSLARQYELTAYDAAYLCLALVLGLPLASKDAKLNAAAQKAGVRLFV